MITIPSRSTEVYRVIKGFPPNTEFTFQGMKDAFPGMHYGVISGALFYATQKGILKRLDRGHYRVEDPKRGVRPAKHSDNRLGGKTRIGKSVVSPLPAATEPEEAPRSPARPEAAVSVARAPRKPFTPHLSEATRKVFTPHLSEATRKVFTRFQRAVKYGTIGERMLASITTEELIEELRRRMEKPDV